MRADPEPTVRGNEGLMGSVKMTCPALEDLRSTEAPLAPGGGELSLVNDVGCYLPAYVVFVD